MQKYSNIYEYPRMQKENENFVCPKYPEQDYTKTEHIIYNTGEGEEGLLILMVIIVPFLFFILICILGDKPT
jgi:hypothetical protein